MESIINDYIIHMFCSINLLKILNILLSVTKALRSILVMFITNYFYIMTSHIHDMIIKI